MSASVQHDERLDNYRKKALSLYKANNGVRYSFAHFEGVYAELTYYMVSHILAEHDLVYLDNVLMTLLRECISNAVKANLKRAFFESQGANIENEKSYNELMTRFKSEGVSRLEDHLEIIKRMGLQVQLFFDIRQDKIRFAIENNAGMTAEELLRVRQRIDAASKLESMAEAFDKFEDELEGAGLGLLISIMLLRKTGIGPENFRIASDQSKTRVSISIPRSLKKPAAIVLIYEKAVSEIESIPTFPQSIKRVLELCDNPDSDTSLITSQIEKDPSLATSILKLANSGGFIAGNHINSIQHAIAIIGIQNLRQLAMALSSQKILNHQYKIYESFWQHSEKCAIYARLLAKELGYNKIADTVYLGGLLHDLGKIILLALDPDEIGKIQGINMSRSENSTAVLEEISLGISHTQIGARLAQHWKFPDEIQAIIRHHHSVYAAQKDYITEVSLVHLSDAFLRTEDSRANYIYYDETCLDRLGINSMEELEILHQQIKTTWQEYQNKTRK